MANQTTLVASHLASSSQSLSEGSVLRVEQDSSSTSSSPQQQQPLLADHPSSSSSCSQPPKKQLSSTAILAATDEQRNDAVDVDAAAAHTILPRKTEAGKAPRFCSDTARPLGNVAGPSSTLLPPPTVWAMGEGVDDYDQQESIASLDLGGVAGGGLAV